LAFKKVKAMPNFQLEVEFIDGTTGFVEMINLITGDKAGVFSVLKDKELFNQVYLAYGVATWPGEIDLAPDTMHDAIKQKGCWIL
jgi:hypothetical protein